MNKLFQYFLKNLNFRDSERRYRFQLLIVSFVFFVAGTVFTIINFKDRSTYELGYVTASFGALSLITFVLTLTVKKARAPMEFTFVTSALIMFGYFLIDGGAGDRGFSTYWILLLPFLSMLVLGLWKGTLTAGIMLAAIVFFLWTDYGKSLLTWPADATFCTRFPLVYLAGFVASILFEFSRSMIDKYAQELNSRLQMSANHDFLTGLVNRTGMQETFEEIKEEIADGSLQMLSCMLIDVDNFKLANDKYGHAFGDEVLKAVSAIFRDVCGERAIRFGGDEFVLIFENKTDFELYQLAEDMRLKAQELKFAEHPEYHLTISIGIASAPVDDDYKIDRIIELADYQSSRAKRSGKNMIYIVSYEQIQESMKKKSKGLFDILGDER